jgi:murein DD-endopeptidase MepM/ murein hydrolase activator NlpD
VISPADGTVTYARNDVPDNPQPEKIEKYLFLSRPEPWWAVGDNCVVIDHGNGEFSFLAHMQKGSVQVKKGDHVAQRQMIGLLGNSGNADGPHLHYHLMAGPTIFRSDGLPSRFSNTDIPVPKRGIFSSAE